MSFFNTRNYSWSETYVAINGDLLEMVEGVSFNTTAEFSFQYGAGNNPHDIREGNRENRGRLRIQQGALENLLDTVPSGLLVDLKADISVSFMDNDGQVVNYNLLMCRFEGGELGQNQNDKYAVIEVPFLYLKQDRR